MSAEGISSDQQQVQVQSTPPPSETPVEGDTGAVDNGTAVEETAVEDNSIFEEQPSSVPPKNGKKPETTENSYIVASQYVAITAAEETDKEEKSEEDSDEKDAEAEEKEATDKAEKSESWCKRILNGVVDTVKDVSHALVAGVEKVLDVAKDVGHAVVAGVEKVLDVAKDVGGTIVTVADKAIDNAKDKLATVKDTLKSAFSKDSDGKDSDGKDSDGKDSDGKDSGKNGQNSSGGQSAGSRISQGAARGEQNANNTASKNNSSKNNPLSRITANLIYNTITKNKQNKTTYNTNNSSTNNAKKSGYSANSKAYGNAKSSLNNGLRNISKKTSETKQVSNITTARDAGLKLKDSKDSGGSDAEIKDSKSLANLQASEEILSEDIGQNEDMLDAIENGDNEIIEAAEENFDKAEANYEDSLDFANDPEVIETKNQIDSLTGFITEAQQQVGQLEIGINDVNTAIDGQQITIDNIKMEMGEIQDNISRLRHEDASPSEIAQMQSLYNNAKKEYDEAKERQKELEEQRTQLIIQKNSVEQFISSCTTTKNAAEVALEHYKTESTDAARKMMNQARQTVEDVKSNLIKQVTQQKEKTETMLTSVRSDLEKFADILPDTKDDDEPKITEDNPADIQPRSNRTQSSFSPKTGGQPVNTDFSPAKENTGFSDVYEAINTQDKQIASGMYEDRIDIVDSQDDITQTQNEIYDTQNTISPLEVDLDGVYEELLLASDQYSEIEMQLQNAGSLNESEIERKETQKQIISNEIERLVTKYEALQEQIIKEERELEQKREQRVHQENEYRSASGIYNNDYEEAIAELEALEKRKRNKEK